MRAAACLVAAIGALVVVQSPLASPPSGLTKSGRLLWNLEALLHDKFGNKPVYVTYVGRWPYHPGDFSTHFVDDARSRYFIYTFAAARHSAFKLERPSTPPKPSVGVAGGETPLTLRGAYISCGSAKWLYEQVASPLVVYEPVVVFRGGRGARAVGERGATAAGPGDS